MADCLEINAFLKNSKEIILYVKQRKCYNVYSYVYTVLIKILLLRYFSSIAYYKINVKENE